MYEVEDPPSLSESARPAGRAQPSGRPRPATRRAAVRLAAGYAGHGVAHRRAEIGRDRPVRRGSSRVTAVIVAALATFLIGSLLLAGVAAVGTVAVVSALSQGLPDPTNLGALTFAQPTIVYDRTGKVELGRFQREQRRVVTFD